MKIPYLYKYIYACTYVYIHIYAHLYPIESDSLLLYDILKLELVCVYFSLV